MATVAAGDLPYVWFGRRVKPMAFAASIATASIATGPWYAGDTPGAFHFDSPAGWVQGCAGLTAAVLFCVGWWRVSSTLVQVALVLTVFVFTSRVALIGLETGPAFPAFWLSVSWAVAAAGAFLLERTPLPPTTDRRRVE